MTKDNKIHYNSDTDVKSGVYCCVWPMSLDSDTCVLNTSSWFLNTCYSVPDDIGGPQPGPFLVNVMGASLQSLPLPLPPPPSLHATIQHSLSLNGKGVMVAMCAYVCVCACVCWTLFCPKSGPTLPFTFPPLLSNLMSLMCALLCQDDCRILSSQMQHRLPVTCVALII